MDTRFPDMKEILRPEVQPHCAQLAGAKICLTHHTFQPRLGQQMPRDLRNIEINSLRICDTNTDESLVPVVLTQHVLLLVALLLNNDRIIRPDLKAQINDPNQQ